MDWLLFLPVIFLKGDEMAETVQIVKFHSCPACKSEKVEILSFYNGTTFQAKCAKCAYGTITGDSKKQALARLKSRYLNTKTDNINLLDYFAIRILQTKLTGRHTMPSEEKEMCEHAYRLAKMMMEVKSEI